MEIAALTKGAFPSPMGRGLRALMSGANLGEKGEGLRPRKSGTDTPRFPTHRPSDRSPSPCRGGTEIAARLGSKLTTAVAAIPKREPQSPSLPGTGRGDHAKRGGWGLVTTAAEH
jgi:hypothetical protein